MKKYNILTIAILFFGITALKAQDTIKDPLLKFKELEFSEFGFSLNGTRVNTNYTHFVTDKGIYDFEKGSYLPTIDVYYNKGLYFKMTDTDLFMIKSGDNLITREAKLVDETGAKLKFSEYFMQIPIQIGMRQKRNHNTIKNNYYNAIEYNVGLYVSIPIYEKLDYEKNFDAEGNFSFGRYIRFGTIAEIMFSSLDEKGHGHKFGFRVTMDFNSIKKFKDTKYNLYPYYNSFGVFYNISNSFETKKKSKKDK